MDCQFVVHGAKNVSVKALATFLSRQNLLGLKGNKKQTQEKKLFQSITYIIYQLYSACNESIWIVILKYKFINSSIGKIKVNGMTSLTCIVCKISCTFFFLNFYYSQAEYSEIN